MDNTPATLSVLSAMITPAVLILASASLLLTTSQRLTRAIERTRFIYEQFETMEVLKPGASILLKKYTLLKSQLITSTKRAGYLQKVMTVLIISLCTFVLTSVSIGIIGFTELTYTWIPEILGLTGAILLFYATILLILETRVALVAVKEEIEYALQTSDEHYKRMK